MANPTDVLFQLQTRINTLDRIKDIKVNSEDEELEEDIGGNTTAGFGSSLSNRYDSDGADVDDAEAVDEPYVTNRPIAAAGNSEIDDTKVKIEQIFQEAEEDEVPPEETPEEPPAEAPPEEVETETEVAPEGEMPPEGAEAGMEDMSGMEGGEAGMPGMEEEAKSPSEIGRIYELKKIYTRLTTIESYLSDSSDPELLRVRLLVSKSIELFEILSSNIPTYQPPKAPKERIDEIIIMYYKFLKQVYESVAKHYKTQSSNISGVTKANISISDKELI